MSWCESTNLFAESYIIYAMIFIGKYACFQISLPKLDIHPKGIYLMYVYVYIYIYIL